MARRGGLVGVLVLTSCCLLFVGFSFNLDLDLDVDAAVLLVMPSREILGRTRLAAKRAIVQRWLAAFWAPFPAKKVQKFKVKITKSFTQT